MNDAMAGGHMHMWMPLLALTVLVLAATGVFALVLRLRRAVDVSGLGRPEPPEQTPLDGAQAERDTFIVIPDISGYTRFMNLTRFAAAHAQLAVSRLLASMLDVAAPLQPTRVEGDSVVFCAAADAGDGGVPPTEVAGAVKRLVDAFYARRAELVARNLCPCNACQHLAMLDLKVIVHRGAVQRYRLRGMDDLSGIAVIEAHRLLKSSVAGRRYALVSEAAAAVVLPWPSAPEAHCEAYEGVGEMRCRLYPLPRQEDPRGDAGGRERAGDVAAKLVSNIRSLAG